MGMGGAPSEGVVTKILPDLRIGASNWIFLSFLRRLCPRQRPALVEPVSMSAISTSSPSSPSTLFTPSPSGSLTSRSLSLGVMFKKNTFKSDTMVNMVSISIGVVEFPQLKETSSFHFDYFIFGTNSLCAFVLNLAVFFVGGEDFGVDHECDRSGEGLATDCVLVAEEERGRKKKC